MQKQKATKSRASMYSRIKRFRPPPPDIAQKDVAEYASRARTVGEVTLVVLATAGMLATMAIAPNAVQLFRYLPLFRDFETPRKRRQLPQVLARLAQKGFVNKTPDGYRITRRGYAHLEKTYLRGLPRPHPRTWDRKWRVLTFDVPEGVRIRRDILRKYIDQIGFVPLQQSVWIFPFPCEEILDLFRRHLQLGRTRIRALVAETFDGDEIYREHFGLPEK